MTSQVRARLPVPAAGVRGRVALPDVVTEQTGLVTQHVKQLTS